ncbi:MAG TPA: cytochrome c oxidase assembly protein, partial [Acetobacteraceae bacterium]|nr:cytochrome c oxidase assembly protein [Acetobacteraceae bacterium]
FSWVEFLTAALTLWCYGRGLGRTAPGLRPSAWRQAAVLAGVLASYAVLQTRFDYMAQHMFALSRVQHMTTHHLGPFLIALGWPGDTLQRGLPAPLRRLSAHPALVRAISLLQQPAPAALLFAGLIVLWLIPAVHFRAMIDTRVYALMNWSMLGDGLLFWILILDPRGKPPALLSFGMRLLLVMAVQLPQIMLGAFISLTRQDLYPFYELCGRFYPSIPAQLDQQLGGFVIYVGGGMMSAAAALILFGRLWRAETVAMATKCS